MNNTNQSAEYNVEFGELLGAVYFSGNHASFEGCRPPSDSSILRIVCTGGEQ